MSSTGVKCIGDIIIAKECGFPTSETEYSNLMAKAWVQCDVCNKVWSKMWYSECVHCYLERKD